MQERNKHTKKTSMNTRRLLIISWTITTVLFILTVGSYICNFWRYGISDDPAQWGQVGDYFGGILNPVISLISLIVLTYISITVSRIEDQRNEFTLQELARPLGQVICGDYENLIQVKLKNCGLGPLIITNIIVRHSNGTVTNNLVQQMPMLPQNFRWTDFIVDGRQFAVAKDTEINIIKMAYDADNTIFATYRTQLRQTLRHLTIEVEYADIYGRPMTSAISNLELFGRTLED